MYKLGAENGSQNVKLNFKSLLFYAFNSKNIRKIQKIAFILKNAFLRRKKWIFFKKCHLLYFPYVFWIDSIKQKWLKIQFYLLGPIFRAKIVHLSKDFFQKISCSPFISDFSCIFKIWDSENENLNGHFLYLCGWLSKPPYM